MPTQAQINANRLNAQKSTGPRGRFPWLARVDVIEEMMVGVCEGL